MRPKRRCACHNLLCLTSWHFNEKYWSALPGEHIQTLRAAEQGEGIPGEIIFDGNCLKELFLGYLNILNRGTDEWNQLLSKNSPKCWACLPQPYPKHWATAMI